MAVRHNLHVSLLLSFLYSIFLFVGFLLFPLVGDRPLAVSLRSFSYSIFYGLVIWFTPKERIAKKSYAVDQCLEWTPLPSHIKKRSVAMGTERWLKELYFLILSSFALRCVSFG